MLTQLFGTITFGDLAVDGFFVISGCLIAQSWERTPELAAYFRKRIVRIYPAFIVCSIVCLAIVAPLAGGSSTGVIRSISRVARLESPLGLGIFEGTYVAALNGSAWTIPYEFRCYILIAMLGMMGALRRPLWIGLMAIAAYLLFVLFVTSPWLRNAGDGPLRNAVIGDPVHMVRLVSVFLVGTLFYLKPVRYSAIGAFVSGVALIACLFIPAIAQAGVAVFGGYLIFWFAGRAPPFIAKINSEDDVSYGLYLYAWPIEKLLMWYSPSAPLLAYGAATIVLAYLAGWASWTYLEKPMMDRFAGRPPIRRVSASA